MTSANQPQPEGKIRVLIVAPSFDILGGQSVQAARLLEKLEKEPSLEVAFLPINPRLPGALHRLQRVKYLRTVVTSIAYVASLFWRTFRYDVVHVFSASYLSFVLAPTPAILISKLYGRKVLLNYHSGEAEDHLQRWRSAIPTIKLVDSLVVPSKYLVRVFGAVGLKAIAIFNLIDTEKFRFRERVVFKPIFLSNRNLEIHYGVDKVLRAFAKIQNAIPDASLTVAGDGSQSRALQDLARELKLDNTNFIGRVDPHLVHNLYDSADVYLNGSEIDNQPLSILEAFSCGLPIVTTDAGGIPDIVTDNKTAMLVPCGDFEQMAQKALSLLDNQSRAKEMVYAAHQECLKYSWSVVRGEWLSVYHDLMGRPLVDEVEMGSFSQECEAITR